MEKVRPWCGQPSDRGRLKNGTEQCLEGMHFHRQLLLFLNRFSYLNLDWLRHAFSVDALDILHSTVLVSDYGDICRSRGISQVVEDCCRCSDPIQLSSPSVDDLL